MRRPVLGRDTMWLASSDGLAIILGLAGQIILAKALLQSDYGLLVVILDAFATMYILIDAGLPTILARDVPRATGKSRQAVHKILKLQGMIAIPFVILSLFASHMIWSEVPTGLLEVCAIVAIGHIMSYPHRSVLRALGEARIESIVKLSERLVATSLYWILLSQGYTDPRMYAAAFAIAVLISLALAIWRGEKIVRDDGDELPEDWSSNKSLFIAALPFAVTLGILPYVTKLEKFLLAGISSYEDAGLYHVAQLAWIAGLMLPQAMRAALLPYLGEVRDEPREFSNRMLKAHHYTVILVPIGLLIGHLVVKFAIPTFFDAAYSDAVEVFDILLAGWVMTLLAVPWYVALQAGHSPWRFTTLIGLVVLIAGISGYLLIPSAGVLGAAWASVIGCAVMLSMAKFLCDDLDWLTDMLAILAVLTAYLISIGSWFALIGILTVIPAMSSIRELRGLPGSDQEE
jgi:O-antigen/teichoic acid export membrane protein